MNGVVSCAKCGESLGFYDITSVSVEVELRMTCGKCWTVTAIRKVVDPQCQ